jgi:hypothetical protein
MAGVTVVVGMRMACMTMVIMTVVMIMGMGGHPPYSTRVDGAAQPFHMLITQYDTLIPRID